jgi:hypothetical protein
MWESWKCEEDKRGKKRKRGRSNIVGREELNKIF